MFSFLENRIPPPIVMLVCIIVMWIAPGSREFGEANITITAISIGLVILGISVASLGVAQFKRVSTTINPLDPEKASALVTSGVFHYSRNPMYLGMLFVLIANALYLGNPWLGFVILAFILFINRFQIEPEERAMRELFGESFQEYRSKVSRWL